ncbi:MAG TPA: ABC transporter substrate-binding protein [Crenotrichaceae bacterium]|nr:ABC transporter substrate-binding protein [Crenotrichaceae bacterium]
MEKHFTRKDFIVLAAIGLVLLTLFLLMYQIDRQWSKLSTITQIMKEQARDIRQLKRSLSNSQFIQTAGVRDSFGGKNKGEVSPVFKRAEKATQMPDYAEGDWLVGAFGVNLKTITPLVSEDAYSSTIHNYVLESLITRDADTLEWQGLVARSWQISPDGLTFTFHLRDDVVFSDGEPLTADDIVFSFDFIMNPAIQAPRQRAYFSKIKRVVAASRYKVVFEFKEPYYNALALAGGMSIMPKHYYARYLEKPNQFNQSKGLLLGSGPYRLQDAQSWRPDRGLVELERNERYWGDVQPSFDKLVWRVIENDSARLTAFRNGEIDSYSARPLEYKKLLKDKQILEKASHYEYMSPVKGYSYIGWNQQRKGKPTIFSDVRVREAMTYLIDRKRIINDVFLGYGEPAMSPFSPLSKQHNTRLKRRPFDLKKAKALLKQAGFEDRDRDGIIEDRQGKPFTFELIYFQSRVDTERMVLLLKDMFAQAGIILKPKPTEWAVMLDTLKQRDFDAITLGWTGSIESDLYQIFHSSQIADGGNNSVGYNNPELDKVIELARANVDEQERMKLWHKAEEILYQDQPYTFLVRLKSLEFVDKRIHNVLKTRLGLNLGTTPIENYVPEGLQKHRN